MVHRHDATKASAPQADAPVPQNNQTAAAKRPSVKDAQEKRQFAAFIKLALYSAFMFTLPFAVFTANAYTLLDPLYAVTIGIPSPDKRTTVGGVLAVIVANIVVALFVFTAFNDEDAAEVEAKKD